MDIVLPARVLDGLLQHCAKDDSGRTPMREFRVQRRGHNQIRLAATDNQALAYVDLHEPDNEVYESPTVLWSEDEERSDFILDPSAFRGMSRAKKSRVQLRLDTMVAAVPVRSSSSDGGEVRDMIEVGGTFPPVDEMIPSSGGGESPCLSGAPSAGAWNSELMLRALTFLRAIPQDPPSRGMKYRPAVVVDWPQRAKGGGEPVNPYAAVAPVHMRPAWPLPGYEAGAVIMPCKY